MIEKGYPILVSYWMLSVSLSVVHASLIPPDTPLCIAYTFNSSHLSHAIVPLINLVLHSACYLICCMCSVLTLHYIKQSGQTAGRRWSSNETHMAIKTTLIMTAYLLRLTLIILLTMHDDMSVAMDRSVTSLIALVLLPIIAIVNPIVYTVWTTDFWSNIRNALS